MIEPVDEGIVDVITQGGLEDLQNRLGSANLIPNDTSTHTTVSEEIEVITQGGVER